RTCARSSTSKPVVATSADRAIETGLFDIQAEFLLAPGPDPSRGPGQPATLQTPAQANGHKIAPGSNERGDPPARNQDPLSTPTRRPRVPRPKCSAIAQYFLRLSKLDPSLFDRAGSYEARLWRQAAQTIWTLEAMRAPSPALRRRPFRKPAMRFYWGAGHSSIG